MNEQLITDLKATRENIASAGWCKGQLEDDNGHFCIDGAILAATGFAQFWNDADAYKLIDDPKTRSGKVALALLPHIPQDWRQWHTETYGPVEDVHEILYDYNDHPTCGGEGPGVAAATTVEDINLVIDKAIAEAGGMA